MSDDHIDDLIYFLEHPSEVSSDEETLVLRVNEAEQETIDNVVQEWRGEFIRKISNSLQTVLQYQQAHPEIRSL